MATAKAGAKRAKKVVEAEGIAHITATFNNTLITITDHSPNPNRLSQPQPQSQKLKLKFHLLNR